MSKTYTSGALTLEVTDGADAIRVRWRGKSTARDPGTFLLPLLSDVLQASTDQRKALVMDFQDAEYFNSSTISPLIRILETARRGSNPVTVLYDKQRKWQELSFTALEVFHTGDGRIEILGV